MKRINLATILIVLFLIPCNSAYADKGTDIYIPSIEAESGKTVNIPVMLDHIDNLAGVKMVMKYDKKILKFKKAVKTKYTSSLMHIVNDKKPGILIIVMAGARGIKGKNFPILVLVFDTKKGLKTNHTTMIKITEAQLMSDKLKNIKYSIHVNPLVILPYAVKIDNVSSGKALK